MGRYNQVLEPLIWELLGCIFDEYAIHEKYFNPKNMIASMSELHTYFDLYHEASAQLDDVKDELEIIQQGHSMKRIVKRFQTVRLAFDEAACFIRDACFKTWHALTKHRKRLRHIGLWRGIRYRWKVWRDYVKDRTHREMEEYETELDRKIERLQELNHLITEHNAVSLFFLSPLTFDCHR